jgi:hypothetical protein
VSFVVVFVLFANDLNNYDELKTIELDGNEGLAKIAPGSGKARSQIQKFALHGPRHETWRTTKQASARSALNYLQDGPRMK